MENYFKILGLKETATQEEIRERYLFLVKAYHPDRYQDPKERQMADEELKKINIAYNEIRKTQNKVSADTNGGFSGNKNEDHEENNEVDTILKYCKELLFRWNSRIDLMNFSMGKVKYYSELKKIIGEIETNSSSLPAKLRKQKIIELQEFVDFSCRIGLALGFEVGASQGKTSIEPEKVLNYLAKFVLFSFSGYLELLTTTEKNHINENPSFQNLPNTCVLLTKVMCNNGFAYHKANSGSTSNEHFNQKSESSGESGYRTGRSDRKSENRCQNCGTYTYTTHSTYRKNIGLLILRRYSKVEGELCADCNERLFWNAFLTNVFLGWWGVISCIINPFLIISNIFEYISSWKIRKLSEFSPKSNVDYKLLSLIGILTILFFFYVISAANKYSLPSVTITPVNDVMSPTVKIKTPTPKSVLTATKTPSPAVIFSDDFSDLTNGQLIVTNPADSSLHWTQFKDTISDGIITVTVNNQIMPSAHAGEIILWRIVDSNNFYYFWMNGLGTVSVRKFVNDKHTILFTSEKPISGATGAKVPVIISTIGNQIKIYVAGKNVTTLYDLSFDSGKIGLGALTDKEKQITSSFDNLIVYSATEFERVFPKNTPSSYLSVLQTPAPRKTVDSRVRFTVKNDYSHTQEVYCEGKLMLTLQPGEEAWFMVPKGTWRFDFCSPGSYPCNNVYSITVNGTYKWTIK